MKVRTNDPEFDAFWGAYPRCIDKVGTHRAFARARSVATVEQIMDGLAAYPFNQETHLQPHSCTWLNQRRWEGYQLNKPHTTIVQPSRSSWRDKYDHDEIPFQSFPEQRHRRMDDGHPVIDGRYEHED
jgi:hypothetical protein